MDHLLTLIIATTNASASAAAHSVNLIHEDDAGRILLGLHHPERQPRLTRHECKHVSAQYMHKQLKTSGS